MNVLLPARRIGVSLPGAALAAATIAAVVATWLAALAFAPRLPAGFGGSMLFWGWYSAFALAVPLFALAAHRAGRSADAVEAALVISLGMAGLALSAVAAGIALNLDASTYTPIFGSPAALLAVTAGAFASFGLGRRLASLAGLERLRREAISNRRFAWIAQVRADRAWRLANAVLVGVPVLGSIGVVLAIPPSPPVLVGWLAVVGVVGVAAGQTAWVSITDRGVRVTGSVVVGWSVPLSEILAVRVAEADPRVFDFGIPGRRCVLRRGPALEVLSRRGDRYLVSLPNAADAVSVLVGLLPVQASSAAS